MRPYAIGGLALLLVFGLSPGRAGAQAAPQPQAAAAAAAEAGPSCGDCHDQAKAFSANPHAHGKATRGQVVPNAVCETCHGNGKGHIEGGGDKAQIYKPVGVEGANKTCLGCHNKNTDRIGRQTGFHGNSTAVNCLSCHAIHTADGQSGHLLARKQLALCETCHATQVASFRNKPYGHRLGRGGMECSTCHEPHGWPQKPSNLRVTLAGDLPCVRCHSEKTGPFVFNHGAVQIGDCTSCHEEHGSSNARFLKRATVKQMCIECHSPITGTTMGSQPPSFHNLNDVRYQSCTTCHVAIHGSNRDPQLLK